MRPPLLVALSVVAIVAGACSSAGSASPSASAAAPGGSTAAGTPAAGTPAASGATGGLPETVCNADIKASIVVSGWEVGLQALANGDEAFHKCFPGIEVKYYTAISAAGFELVIAAGKGAPDIGMFDDGGFAKFVKLGGLVDITDKVQPYLDKAIGYEWADAQKDGKYYGFPEGPGPVAVYYNRDVFTAAGVDPATIVTWDDYYKAAKVIKDKTGVPMLALAKAANYGDFFNMTLWSRRINLVDQNGAVIIDKEPKVREILDYMKKLWDAGYAIDLEGYSDPYYKALADGKLATEVGPTWWGGILKAQVGDKGKGKWGIFPLPVFADGEAHSSNGGGDTLAIFEQSTQKEAAWDYIQFHVGRVDVEIAKYKAFDILPGLTPAYDDPAMQAPDPYFGGQATGILWAQAARDIPQPGPYTADYYQMTGLLVPELQKWATGQQTAEQALANAAGQIRSQTGRP